MGPNPNYFRLRPRYKLFLAFLINDEMVHIYFMSLFYNLVCFRRRSKAHQRLCLLLCTVMPSLNKCYYLSYLITQEIAVLMGFFTHKNHAKVWVSRL